MLIEDSFEQNTDSWMAAKLGKPSASKLKQIITSGGKASKQREAYLYKLAGETISGYREPEHQTQEMKDGIEREDEARMFFSKLYQGKVTQVGLVYKDEKREVLCSPDGLMLEDGCGLEIKNRNVSNHTKCLATRQVHYDSIVQVQASMWITGFSHWWYFSYHPMFKNKQGCLLVKRDEAFISKLSKEIDLFVKELREIVSRLKQL
jgi:hypothetical protein